MSAPSQAVPPQSQRPSDLRMARSTAIALSLSAFAWGFPALLPVAGLVPALHVLRCSRRIRKGFHPQWNPAAGYLAVGVILAAIGLIGTGIIIVTIMGLATSGGGSS